MNLICRVKSILEPAVTVGRSPLHMLTLVASASLLIGAGSTTCSMAMSAVPIIQEHDEPETHVVKIRKHHSDSDDEIKVVVVRDGDSITKELVKKLKSDHMGQLYELAAETDANVEVAVEVIQEGDKGHQGMLKKLKSDLKSQLHEIILDADDNNVFVLQDNDEGDVKMDLHRHVADLLHGQKLGKHNHQALAEKLRQLADRLEAKNHEPHAVHKTDGKIEIHQSGEHKFHIKKRGKNENANHQKFEFTTDGGKHIVIGKPSQEETIVVELNLASGEKLHSHDGDQMRIILNGEGHGSAHNVVEGIHFDGDHSPSDLSQKITGRIKKHLPDHKLVIEEFHLDGGLKTHEHKLHASSGTTSDEGLDASIRDLKNELKELREELKELRSDRKRNKRK